MPVLVKMLEMLAVTPDLVIVDGHSHARPR
ncbi:hypothetical protein FIM12_05930 [SAR202 cluster bacterium AD-804-J14_MRT_500m]|nr:hypothetical protein [SAR202 cluster bacterium AD-804-J14_MRT_500m]